MVAPQIPESATPGLEETIRRHDRYQFEVKRIFPFAKPETRFSDYRVETFFFIPTSLHINRDTWTKEDFYRNLKTNIRLRTPTYSLAALAGEDADPLQRLQSAVHELSVRPDDEKNTATYKYHVKVFSLIFKRSLRLACHAVCRQELPRIEDIEEFSDRAEAVLARFRTLYHEVDTLEDQWLRQIFRFADEYISTRVEYYGLKIIEKRQIQTAEPQDRELPALFELIKREQCYRAENGLGLLPDKKGSNEELIYRHGVLKKYLSNVLFLETSKKKEGVLVEQMLFSLAAGVSMVFATSVAFIWQKQYGTLSLPLFAALVVSYIFKDRLKNVIRYYSAGFIDKRLYDRKRVIYHSFRVPIGSTRESARFLEQHQLPARVQAIRRDDPFREIDNHFDGEKILHYRQHIRLNNQRFRKVEKRYVTEGILDISRFNIHSFLGAMDDPVEPLLVVEDGFVRKTEARRVYHLNMIRCYTNETGTTFLRFRIVLNKDGIQRIEQVAGEENRQGLEQDHAAAEAVPVPG